MFVVSAALAGVAGALYAPQVGIITPGQDRRAALDRDDHLGGGGRARHAGLGPVVGAFGRQLAPEHPDHDYPDLWLLVLGGLFVAVVLFFPDGRGGHRPELLVRLGSGGGAGGAVTAAPDDGRGPKRPNRKPNSPHSGALA